MSFLFFSYKMDHSNNLIYPIIIIIITMIIKIIFEKNRLGKFLGFAFFLIYFD